MSDLDPMRINYRWKSVEISPGNAYTFPYKISKFMKDENDRPAIYRWAVYSPRGELKAVYFGEAENLVKRVDQYLRPGKSQQTNGRLHLNLHRYVENQSIVKLDVLDFDPVHLNSIALSPSSFHDHFLRRMLEAFVISDFVASGAVDCSLMNLKMNPTSRRIRKAIRIISETSTDAPPGGPENSTPPSRLR
jgi:hypothetical protein